MLSPRVSSQPRGQTCVSDISCIGKRVLYQQHLLGSPIALLTGCIIPHWMKFFQFQNVTRNILPIKITHFASKHASYKNDMNDPQVTPEWARPRNLMVVLWGCCLFTGLVLRQLQPNSLPHSSGSRLPHNPGIPCHLRLLESPFRHHHKVYYSKEGRGVGPAKRPLGNGEI